MMQMLQQAKAGGATELMASMPAIYPVNISQIPPNQQYPQGGQQFDHVPLSFKVIKDLKQACIQYGVTSPYILGLVSGLAKFRVTHSVGLGGPRSHCPKCF